MTENHIYFRKATLKSTRGRSVNNSQFFNLGDMYYLIQLIVRQILIFLRNFVFREFMWFTPAEEDLDNAGSKIRAVASQHPIADLLVFLAICGLLFAFMILSNSPKNETSNYNTSNIEMISMALEENPSSFWYSRTAGSGLTSCFHACGDSIGPSRDVVPKMQNISRPATLNTRVSPRKESRSSDYNARASYIKHSQKTSRSASQTIPREWLIRRTRSGHVYGKYPI